MDEIAERGFAAHWKYKGENTGESELDKWIKRIRNMLENPKSDALEFLDEFKMNLFSSEIMAFTPKGDLVSLPKYSTALDFAYEIHTEIGNKAIGAKINHKLVPLNYILSSGDQVEIITSNKQRIQKEWLSHVRTAKAKSSITNSLKAETKNRIDLGKKVLETKLKELNIHPSSRVFRKILPEYSVKNKDELYSKIGSGIIKLDDLKKVLKKNTKNKFVRYWGLQIAKTTSSSKKSTGTKVPKQKEKFNYKDPVIIRDDTDLEENKYKIAKCCNPIPGDNVIGYKNPKEDYIFIHKAKCPNAIKLMSSQGNYIIKVKWTSQKFLSSLAKLTVNGIDRIGIVSDITTVISEELDVNIRKIFIETHDGIFEGEIELYVHSVKDLNNLIMDISKIKGVESVKRKEEIRN